MPAVEVNGLSVHHETAGSGPPVLLIHGLGSSTQDWEKQVPAFEDSHTVICVDLRGHGRSENPPGPYSIEIFADDVAGLLDHLDIGPVAVVGISLGGMVGFQLAADRPDLVGRVMAINAVPAFDVSSIGMRAQIWMRKLIARIAGMEKIGKPIVVVASDQDYTTVKSKRPYVDQTPGAEMVVIENAHHAVPVERPEVFNEVLKEFLRQPVLRIPAAIPLTVRSSARSNSGDSSPARLLSRSDTWT